MTEAAALATLLSVLVTCRDLDEVAATWRGNQTAIKSLSPADFAALVLAKDKIKDNFARLVPEEHDTWVADFMEGRI